MENPEADFEPFEPLLSPVPPITAPAQLHQELLRQTTAVLRRRVRGRRLATAAALLACYAAGLATMYLAGHWAQRPIHAPPPSPDVAAGPPAVENRPADLAANLPAARLEQAGETATGRDRARIFRLAGTRYLEETGDVRAALRCYANALDEDADTTANPQDHWLLMAVKEARAKEKADAYYPN